VASVLALSDSEHFCHIVNCITPLGQLKKKNVFHLRPPVYFFYFLFPVRSLATTKVVILTLDAPEVTI
jgi:hypothetical protein